MPQRYRRRCVCDQSAVGPSRPPALLRMSQSPARSITTHPIITEVMNAFRAVPATSRIIGTKPPAKPTARRIRCGGCTHAIASIEYATIAGGRASTGPTNPAPGSAAIENAARRPARPTRARDSKKNRTAPSHRPSSHEHGSGWPVALRRSRSVRFPGPGSSVRCLPCRRRSSRVRCSRLRGCNRHSECVLPSALPVASCR